MNHSLAKIVSHIRFQFHMTSSNLRGVRLSFGVAGHFVPRQFVPGDLVPDSSSRGLLGPGLVGPGQLVPVTLTIIKKTIILYNFLLRCKSKLFIVYVCEAGNIHKRELSNDVHSSSL